MILPASSKLAANESLKQDAMANSQEAVLDRDRSGFSSIKLASLDGETFNRKEIRLSRVVHCELESRESCKPAETNIKTTTERNADLILQFQKKIKVRNPISDTMLHTKNRLGTYVIKVVKTTPRETAQFTIIRGSVMMDARPSAGKYNDLITPSHGRYNPTMNS